MTDNAGASIVLTALETALAIVPFCSSDTTHKGSKVKFVPGGTCVPKAISPIGCLR